MVAGVVDSMACMLGTWPGPALPCPDIEALANLLTHLASERYVEVLTCNGSGCDIIWN